MGGRCIATFSYAGGLTSAIFSLSPSVSMLKPSVRFFGLSMLFSMNGGAKSVTYNIPAARRSFGAFVGDVFIGRFFCYSFVLADDVFSSVDLWSFMYQCDLKSGWLVA